MSSWGHYRPIESVPKSSPDVRFDPGSRHSSWVPANRWNEDWFPPLVLFSLVLQTANSIETRGALHILWLSLSKHEVPKSAL